MMCNNTRDCDVDYINTKIIALIWYQYDIPPNIKTNLNKDNDRKRYETRCVSQNIIESEENNSQSTTTKHVPDDCNRVG